MTEMTDRLPAGFVVDIIRAAPLVVASLIRSTSDAVESVSAIVSFVRRNGQDQLPVAPAGVRSASRYSTFPLPPVIGDTVSAPTS